MLFKNFRIWRLKRKIERLSKEEHHCHVMTVHHALEAYYIDQMVLPLTWASHQSKVLRYKAYERLCQQQREKAEAQLRLLEGNTDA